MAASARPTSGAQAGRHGQVRSHPKKGIGDLTVLKRAVAGAHLWRERRLLEPNVFLSDELQAEIARRGLRIPRHPQLKETRHLSVHRGTSSMFPVD